MGKWSSAFSLWAMLSMVWLSAHVDARKEFMNGLKAKQTMSEKSLMHQGWRLEAKWSVGDTEMTRVTKTVKGVEVYGATSIFMRRKGKLKSVLHKVHRNETLVREAAETDPRFSRESAITIASGELNGLVPRDIHPMLEYTVELYLSSDMKELFYIVNARKWIFNYIVWVHSITGAVDRAYANMMSGYGTDSFGIRRNLDGLSKPKASYHIMSSKPSISSRLITHDMENEVVTPGKIARDKDDAWIGARQREVVDAQYNANRFHKFLQKRFRFNWEKQMKMPMRSSVHASKKLNNAIWYGDGVAFGDGDNINYRSFARSAAICAHEFTHGITSKTSKLDYWKLPGALNEAFSDVVAISFLHYINRPTWQIGGDVLINQKAARNLANPRQYNDPSHILDFRFLETSFDNGGVHTNSLVGGHWFYLLVQGGKNADPNRRAATRVKGIGIVRASKIAFKAFAYFLSRESDFCDLRAATVVVANNIDPCAVPSVRAAWAQVGVIRRRWENGKWVRVCGKDPEQAEPCRN